MTKYIQRIMQTTLLVVGGFAIYGVYKGQQSDILNMVLLVSILFMMLARNIKTMNQITNGKKSFTVKRVDLFYYVSFVLKIVGLLVILNNYFGELSQFIGYLITLCSLLGYYVISMTVTITAKGVLVLQNKSVEIKKIKYIQLATPKRNKVTVATKGGDIKFHMSPLKQQQLVEYCKENYSGLTFKNESK